MPLGNAETSALLRIAVELAACSDERELLQRVPELTYQVIGSPGSRFAGHEQEVSEALQVIVGGIYTQLARSGPGNRPCDAGDLTSREREVLHQLIAGLSAQQIAARLKISPATVRKHLEHVYAKLGVHDRLTAANRAREMGLRDARLG